MRRDQPTIWMNVTTSSKWTRPPVGIVRVERSLCRELSEIYGDNFRQCIWDGGGFLVWEAENQINIISNGDELKVENPIYLEQKSPESTGSLQPIFPILPKRLALKALGQALLSLTPSALQPIFNRVLYQLRPIVINSVVNIKPKKWLKNLFNIVVTKKQKNNSQLFDLPLKFPFKDGDIFISIGLDWDYEYYKSFYALRKQNNIKVVTCCYDLIPVLYPHYCVSNVAGIFTSYFLEIADGSDLILCISKQSEKDLNNLLNRTGGARPPTWVFPLGDSLPVAETSYIDSAVVSVCKEPFILYVSSIERRKNHEVLYRAYHLLCAAGKKTMLPKLVFVGMPGWGVAELFKDLELDPQVKDKIVCFNHVTDAELLHCYESALFCVFPSLYEGWGLPVGEALSMGKVVLASNRGSLPEVGGDLVKYVDPWSPQDWAEAIEDMVINEESRKNWQSRIREHYEPRTWRAAGESVRNAINANIFKI